MSLPLAIDLPDEALEVIAARVASLLADHGPARDEWFNVAEAAEYLRAKPQRVYDLVHQGRLDHGRDGSRLLFRRSILDAYLAGAHDLARVAP